MQEPVEKSAAASGGDKSILNSDAELRYKTLFNQSPDEEVHAAEPIPGKGRILVMDDEEIVLTVARFMVKELGYEVSLAENGEQALDEFSAAIGSGRPFDAVILDLTIRGGMGGKETLMKMAALDPSVRAIVSSGYSSDDILSHYKDYGFQDVLIKPYEIEALSRMLHGLFRGGPAPSS